MRHFAAGCAKETMCGVPAANFGDGGGGPDLAFVLRERPPCLALLGAGPVPLALRWRGRLTPYKKANSIDGSQYAQSQREERLAEHQPGQSFQIFHPEAAKGRPEQMGVRETPDLQSVAATQPKGAQPWPVRAWTP